LVVIFIIFCVGAPGWCSPSLSGHLFWGGQKGAGQLTFSADFFIYWSNPYQRVKHMFFTLQALLVSNEAYSNFTYISKNKLTASQ
jgi:hypothetical protein